MAYRERYQYILTFLADAVALIIAVSLSKMIFDIWLNLVLAGGGPRAYLQFYLILAQTFLIGFLCFNQEEDITCRSFRTEVFRSLRMTLLMGQAFLYRWLHQNGHFWTPAIFSWERF